MRNLIHSLFKPTNNFKIQSFTFFIPSPPARSSGYREKQFDKLFYAFINRGYEVISLNTQSSLGTNQSGMWVICLVRALNSEAEKLNLEDFQADTVEGLYYLDEEKNEKS